MSERVRLSHIGHRGMQISRSLSLSLSSFCFLLPFLFMSHCFLPYVQASRLSCLKPCLSPRPPPTSLFVFGPFIAPFMPVSTLSRYVSSLSRSVSKPVQVCLRSIPSSTVAVDLSWIRPCLRSGPSHLWSDHLDCHVSMSFFRCECISRTYSVTHSLSQSVSQ